MISGANAKNHEGPRTGAYYWVPIPQAAGKIRWGLVTCHDLGLPETISHREFWPQLLPHLAASFGADPSAWAQRLGGHCYALPRGRIIQPRSGYVILHGEDAPLPGWDSLVRQRFGLLLYEVDYDTDDHEKTSRDDVQALEGLIGFRLERGSNIGVIQVGRKDADASQDPDPGSEKD